MTYPTRQSAVLAVGGTLSVSFTPPIVGWVNVVCVAVGRAPVQPPPRPGPTDKPPLHAPVIEHEPQVLEAVLELYPPGASAPVVRRSASQVLGIPSSTNHITVWGDAPTGPAVGGTWTAKITNEGTVPLSASATARYPTVPGNLGKIDHVVVLMMENRSFDHMLGHLTIDGGRDDVDGLHAGMANSYQGRSYPVTSATSPVFRDDPHHGFRDVAQQLHNHPATATPPSDTVPGAPFLMDGFVENFAGAHRQFEPPEAVMRYNGAALVPTYAALAEQFIVCDRWFASLPTDTWPNRLYSLCGTSGGLTETPSGDSLSANPPGFELPTIFEQLQHRGVDWNLFFDGVPFPLVFKRLAQDAAYTARMRSLQELLLRAKTGDLPAVTWIDPAFSDIDTEFANDDHPPGDVRGGQGLVAQIYAALASGPAWSKTLFVIAYDEHGGFFDHVPPPRDIRDDAAGLGSLGVRVPALVISPWGAPRSVSHTEYDHTSLLRTILLRFCDGASMTPRADGAADLGPLLSATAPRMDHAAVPAPSQPVAVAGPRDPNLFGQVLRRFVLGF